MEKVTSIRIDRELWKKAKILAIKRGLVLKNLIEELLSNEVEADELLTNKPSFSQQLMDAFKQARTEGKVPLAISSSKSPAELIREGRRD